MTKRRVFYVVIATVLVAGLRGPASNAWSYLQGEPFYRGKPASYWTGELQRWDSFVLSYRCGIVLRDKELAAGSFTSTRFYVRPRAAWASWICNKLPRWGQYLPDQPPILDGDPAAFNVLLALLEDESPKTRQMAADGLGRLEEKASLAVPMLQRRLGDPDAEVRRRTEAALRVIEVKAEKYGGSTRK